MSGLPKYIQDQLGDSFAGVSGLQVVYFNHFFRWEGPVVTAAAPGVGGWIVASTEAGAGATALDVRDSAQHGILRIVTDSADNDRAQIQLNGSGVRWTAGKRLWFGIRLAPQDADDGEIGFGLIIESDTDMVNTFPTDGLFFEKAETATAMDFHARKNGTSTERAALNPTAMADDTFVTYQFFVDETGNIFVYVDGDQVTQIAASDANIPNDEDLTLAIQVQTGAAATRYIDIDWVYVAQER